MTEGFFSLILRLMINQSYDMMRFIVTLLVLCLPSLGFAQSEQADSPSGAKTISSEEQPVKMVFIGYLSYDSLLAVMPQRAIVERQMEELTMQYEAELKRVEGEFNQKYEDFLDGRKDFPRTILLKRQTELEQLMQRNVEFREQSRKELEQARNEAYAPLRQQLSEAIATVARQYHLALVVNTDAGACPFLDPEQSVDISAEVQQALSMKH